MVTPAFRTCWESLTGPMQSETNTKQHLRSVTTGHTVLLELTSPAQVHTDTGRWRAWGLALAHDCRLSGFSGILTSDARSSSIRFMEDIMIWHIFKITEYLFYSKHTVVSMKWKTFKSTGSAMVLKINSYTTQEGVGRHRADCQRDTERPSPRLA